MNENEKPQTAEVVVATHVPMEIAEIESQIATAKRYPRDIKVFKEKLMAMANLDQETAESCYYALPRGGKAIDGPSIRLAEIALACYGNCAAKAEVVEDDGRFIHTVGMCRDLENNVSVQVKIQRRITYGPNHKYKANQRYDDDMIAVTANAGCSIALRNAIFKIVPGAYLKPVFRRCKETAVGKMQSLANRRAEVIAKLTQFGVTGERVLAVIGRKSIEEVTFDDVAVLIGLGTAIKDGDTTVEEAFPPDYQEAQKDVVATIKKEQGSEVVAAPAEPAAPENQTETTESQVPAMMQDD